MPELPTLAAIEEASREVTELVPLSPQITWPLLNARTGAELWVRHENHTAIGSFKIRGAVCYLSRLRRREPAVQGVVAATRGNFGQAVAWAAVRLGLTATVVVPRGNSPAKNRAMRALGAELIEVGDDFQAALEFAGQLAAERGAHYVPSFHPDLVLGNAVSMLDYLRHAPPLDLLYVPIGLGSGICAAMAARDALGLPTRLVGVVAEQAPAMALSLARGRLTVHPAATRIADGMACSTPDAQAFAWVRDGVERVVAVSDAAIEAAIRAIFDDTHNVAEGAAAAALAAVLHERAAVAGRRIGMVFSGGNIDAAVFRRVLAEGGAGA